MAADFQTEPIQLYAGSMELSANPNVKQIVEIVDEFGKKKRLQEILGQIMQEVFFLINKKNFNEHQTYLH